MNGEQVRADIFVDATGRGSRLAKWLEGATGCGFAVETDTLKLGLRYVTFVLKTPPERRERAEAPSFSYVFPDFEDTPQS